MDVGAAAKGFDQTRISGEMGDAPQLDLVVVGDEKDVARARDERLAELTALITAHRDVVKIRLIAAQPARACHGLVEGGVNATIGCDLAHQPYAVGAAQLLHLAVLHQGVDELRPFVAQPQQRRRVGRVARLGLLLRGQLLLGVEQLTELHGRVEVEGASDDALQLGREPFTLRCQAFVEPSQLHEVDRDPDVFHLGEHTDQRILDRCVQQVHALLLESRFQGRREVSHGQRAATRNASIIVTFVGEVELTRGGRSCCRELVRRVATKQVGQGIADIGRVDEVGGNRHVELQAGDADTSTEGPPHQRLGVVTAQGEVRAEHREHIRMGEHLGWYPCHLASFDIGHHRQPDQLTAARLTRPCGNHVKHWQR